MRNLKNAPIAEAIAQVNFQSPGEVRMTDLKKWVGDIRGFNEEHIQEMQIKAGHTPDVSQYGFKFFNPGTKEFLQATRNFFAYSRTSKYTEWLDFRNTASARLISFLRDSQAVNVSRVALRYINKFQIPYDHENLDRYLRIRPVMGNLAQKRPESLTLQYTLPISDIDGRAKVGMRLERAADEKWQVLLDIDVFVSGNFSPTEEAIVAELDKLRDVKNDIFKESLTDETLKTFD